MYKKYLLYLKVFLLLTNQFILQFGITSVHAHYNNIFQAVLLEL